MLATCVRDWALLSLDWVDELDAFDDEIIESMDALRERRGDIKKSNNTFLQSLRSGRASLDLVINAMQNFQLDDEVNLSLPKVSGGLLRLLRCVLTCQSAFILSTVGYSFPFRLSFR